MIEIALVLGVVFTVIAAVCLGISLMNYNDSKVALAEDPDHSYKKVIGKEANEVKLASIALVLAPFVVVTGPLVIVAGIVYVLSRATVPTIQLIISAWKHKEVSNV